MSKKITLLGSTGSIGTQSLDVIRAQGYEVFGLSAHSHVEKILQQIEEFHPKYVCMTDPDAAARLDAALAGNAHAHAAVHLFLGFGDFRAEYSQKLAEKI